MTCLKWDGIKEAVLCVLNWTLSSKMKKEELIKLRTPEERKQEKRQKTLSWFKKELSQAGYVTLALVVLAYLLSLSTSGLLLGLILATGVMALYIGRKLELGLLSSLSLFLFWAVFAYSLNELNDNACVIDQERNAWAYKDRIKNVQVWSNNLNSETLNLWKSGEIALKYVHKEYPFTLPDTLKSIDHQTLRVLTDFDMRDDLVLQELKALWEKACRKHLPMNVIFDFFSRR